MVTFAWHIHHDVLIEPLTEPIENRIAYIKANKPEEEIPVRLRLLKPVVGALPAAVVRAWAAREKAWAAYDKEWAAYKKAVADNRKEIEALHTQECPRCQWNGETIFP